MKLFYPFFGLLIQCLNAFELQLLGQLDSLQDFLQVKKSTKFNHLLFIFRAMKTRCDLHTFCTTKDSRINILMRNRIYLLFNNFGIQSLFITENKFYIQILIDEAVPLYKFKFPAA